MLGRCGLANKLLRLETDIKSTYVHIYKRTHQRRQGGGIFEQEHVCRGTNVVPFPVLHTYARRCGGVSVNGPYFRSCGKNVHLVNRTRARGVVMSLCS